MASRSPSTPRLQHSRTTSFDRTMQPQTPRQDRRVSLLSQPGTYRSPLPKSSATTNRDSMLWPSGDSSVSASESITDVSVGDLVEVPGGWHGNVMYIGPIEGKSGTYLGVDLIALDADKGRNDGTHNGVRYFSTKGKTSGMFIPPGRYRVVDTSARKDRIQENTRPASRQLHIRPNSRLRSVSNRSASGFTASPPRTHSVEIHANVAEAQQKLLNENARLEREVEDLHHRLREAQKAKALQNQEMEELLATVGELETLQGPQQEQIITVAELEEMRAYIEEREQKIEELRADAEARRTEFRQVTEHQQVTIEELKELHNLQISELQGRNSAMEERLLSSDRDNEIAGDSEQLFALQEQLVELSDELDGLVAAQERARYDIETANAKISDLENDNIRLLDDLVEARAKLERVDTESKAVKRGSSVESLPEGHPQKRQTIDFMEIELKRLREQLSSWNSEKVVAENEHSLDLETEITELRSENQVLKDAQKELALVTAALEKERRAREALEDQHEQMEHTLEQTIIHMNSKSPRSSISVANKHDPMPGMPDSKAKSLDQYNVRSPGPKRSQIQQDIPSDGTLWCEYCETSGHDIVSCNAVFGSAAATPARTNGSVNPIVSGFDETDDDEMF